MRCRAAQSALRSTGNWNGCSANCGIMTAAVLRTFAHRKGKKKQKKTTCIVTDLPMSNLFFFRHCVWSKNLTLSRAWMKQRPPLWRKHITSQFLDNFQRAVTAKTKLFERQLGEQIWFVTMIPATYAASYWNAFQNCAANALRPSA